MPRGISDKVVYKPYDQTQQWLIPPSVDELIPANHLVRVVSRTIDEMDLTPLLRTYSKGGGASRFHPIMMFKVFVYGYMTRVYSSRMFAKAMRENVKIESAANKYSFVWKRGIDTNERKLDEKLRAFIKEVDRVAQDENVEYGDRDLEEMGEQTTFTAEDVAELAAVLNERLSKLESQGAGEDVKKLKKDVKQVVSDFLPRKRKYEAQRAILGERNSFSKTDHDATFMRMKEDHFKNGQLKPGYNVQIGTENGFVLGYDIFPNPTDTRTLKPHLENMRYRFGNLPLRVIADAGYGSQENYAYLEKNNIDAIVKDGTFHRAGKRSWRKNPFNTEQWPYDAATDSYSCPEGRSLTYVRTVRRETEGGYAQDVSIYTSESCEGCSQRDRCTRSQGNRTIQRNEELRRLREKAHARLLSE
jgi:transposase